MRHFGYFKAAFEREAEPESVTGEVDKISGGGGLNPSSKPPVSHQAAASGRLGNQPKTPQSVA